LHDDAYNCCYLYVENADLVSARSYILLRYCDFTSLYNDLAEQQREMHLKRFKNNTMIRYKTDFTSRQGRPPPPPLNEARRRDAHLKIYARSRCGPVRSNNVLSVALWGHIYAVEVNENMDGLVGI